VAGVVAFPAAFAPLDAVVDLCTIGTLATVAVVNIAVIALRRNSRLAAVTPTGAAEPVPQAV
jgi:amino acid transporter